MEMTAALDEVAYALKFGEYPYTRSMTMPPMSGRSHNWKSCL